MNRAATSALTHDLCLIMLQMFRFLSWMSFPPSYFVGDKKNFSIKHKNVIIAHQLSRSVKGSCQLMHSRLFFFFDTCITPGPQMIYSNLRRHELCPKLNQLICDFRQWCETLHKQLKATLRSCRPTGGLFVSGQRHMLTLCHRWRELVGSPQSRVRGGVTANRGI